MKISAWVMILGVCMAARPVQSADPASAAVTAEGLKKGLVLHLTCDQDETGSKVTDSSGLANHGKASGVRWTAEGKKGGAYEFRADGDQIVVANNPHLNPRQLTLAAWIKASSVGDKWRRIFDKSYSQGYALSLAADWQGNSWNGLANLEIGPGSHSSMSQTRLADGKWHHVAATFDGTEQLVFVDGRPEGWPLRWSGSGIAGGTDFNLVIGCNRSNLGEDDLGASFRGLIDEPMMWNRALSLQEVAFLAGQGQTLHSDAQATVTAAAEAAGTPSLLKGVVHLTDNDVRFRTEAGIVVFVDPVSWPTDDRVARSGMVRPDLILITHSHMDHFQPTILKEYLALNPKAIVAGPSDVVRMAAEEGITVSEIKPGRSVTMAGVSFSAVPACFLEGTSHPRANQWMGYVLHLDGTNYYVTGDTQPLDEMSQLKVDVLFPLLYGCGGNMEQALRMSGLTKARIVVPVHTSGQDETVKKFVAQLAKGTQGVYYKDGRVRTAQ